ncbi:hypothetical protein [Brevibacterium metallidurans]|uniref:Uncharacterized protein n=1 Tax=Brevibacterium metallidurans TaxID=1482676 RepID=A0ABP3C517_9MICO
MVDESVSPARRMESFTDEVFAAFEPAPLQVLIGAPTPRLRDLDLKRIPHRRRAKVHADLDRPLGWLSPKADGSPGTIRTEIESGRIVGKRADHATDFFSRKSPSEGTSQATEDSSHVSVGVSKLLFDCIHEK